MSYTAVKITWVCDIHSCQNKPATWVNLIPGVIIWVYCSTLEIKKFHITSIEELSKQSSLFNERDSLGIIMFSVHFVIQQLP